MKALLLSLLFILLPPQLNANIYAHSGDVVTGHEVVTIDRVSAYQLNGAKDELFEHNLRCLEKYDWIINNHTIEIDYQINTKTGIQRATVRLLDSNSTLQPMGIYGSYAFLSQQGLPKELEQQNIRQLYFVLNKDFVLRKIAVSFKPENQEFQCLAEKNGVG